ncbi:MAG: hypothetical protein ACP5GC_10650 [Thiomonas sp.]
MTDEDALQKYCVEPMMCLLHDPQDIKSAFKDPAFNDVLIPFPDESKLRAEADEA